MRFENQTFTGEVTLDFNQFVRCTFQRCTVYFHGFDYQLIETRMEEVRFAFGGPANNTRGLLKTLRQQEPEVFEQLIQNAGTGMPVAPYSGKAN
jgi:hypothetical protein